MTGSTALPLAALENPDAMHLVAIGFLFVIAILSLLALLTFLGGRLFVAKAAHAPAPPPPAPHPSAAEARSQKEEADNQITAVVTAAIHVALQDRRFRVRSIRRTAPGWAQEGRRQIFSSHRLR
jgi:sodium pump decarboxylase gamma subunit